MFRNFAIASVIALVLIVAAGPTVQALTQDEIQAKIQELLAKVAELTRQIQELRKASTGVDIVGSAMPAKHRICYILTRNLDVGAEGDDVHGLQEWLWEHKFLAVSPTGYFGQLTADAVRRWQAGEGVNALGAFGPISRERLRIWCGGAINRGLFTASPTRGEAPLTVTFKSMVGGFRPASTYWTIDFGDGQSERAAECSAPADACTSPGSNTHTYTSNGTYTATLNKITDPCPDDGDPTTPRCLAAIQSEVVAKLQISVGPIACTKEYVPVCGAKPIVCITTPCNPIPTTYGNRCTMAADGATFLYEGQCRNDSDPSTDRRCKAWYDGCNTCSRETPDSPAMCTLRACYSEMMAKPYCTAWFDHTTNKPPTISGFSGPTTLALNTQGTWTISASDPEGGPLKYRIQWGDEHQRAYSSSELDSEFVQNTSFTHSYSVAGTYTIKIVVVDSAGEGALTAETTTTVRVGNAPVACTLQYNPVCGRPAGCANTCRDGFACPAVCQLHNPQTYGNRCALDGAGATFLHTGECTSSSGNWY